MSVTKLTQPTELGELASEAISELVNRATGGNPVSTYAEAESPINWAAIEEGGWDFIGVEDDETVTLRDLAEVAKTWGRACIQLPVIPSIIAKRHSEVAQELSGPVTMAIPDGIGNGSALIPYGQMEGIHVVRSFENIGQDPTDTTSGEPDNYDILLRSTRVGWATAQTKTSARETAVMFAAEATGAALQLLDEGVEYVKQRQQFGKSIGTFQAVKHHLANALIDVEMAETALIWASLHPEEAYRGAKFALERALSAAEIIIQVHGGMGFTWELGLHFYLRRIISARDLVSGLEATYT